MRLIIASNNAHKVREIRQIVGKYFTDMSTLRDAGLSIDVVEDGTTFRKTRSKRRKRFLPPLPALTPLSPTTAD